MFDYYNLKISSTLHLPGTGSFNSLEAVIYLFAFWRLSDLLHAAWNQDPTGATGTRYLSKSRKSDNQASNF